MKTCCICGATRAAAGMSLIRWSDKTYGYGPRCGDRNDCHSRCFENGDEWPVEDPPTPRTTTNPSPASVGSWSPVGDIARSIAE